MISKKKFLLIASLAILSMPVASYANLETFNYTNETSAVRIESTGACTGNIPGHHYTDPINNGTPGYNNTKPLEVRLLCTGSSGNKCHALMYASQSCNAGTEVANIIIDTVSLHIDSVSMINSRYAVTTNGESTVYIKYA